MPDFSDFNPNVPAAPDPYAEISRLTKERDDLRRALEHLLANTGLMPDGREYVRDNQDSRNAIVRARSLLTPS